MSLAYLKEIRSLDKHDRWPLWYELGVLIRRWCHYDPVLLVLLVGIYRAMV